MRTEDEVSEMIHKLHIRILAMEDRVAQNEFTSTVHLDAARISIHTMSQEVCLLKWVLERS